MTLTQEYAAYIQPIFERKPKSVSALDVKALTSYTDLVVIVEAGSRRQVTALAEHLIKSLKAKNLSALGVEGVQEGDWALLDFGHLIIHVFETETKGFYDLEGLWSDAPRVDLSQFEALEPARPDDSEGDQEEDHDL